jgi:hypothetical protein
MVPRPVSWKRVKLHEQSLVWVPQAACLLQDVFLNNVRVIKADGFLPVLTSKKGIISTNGIEMLDGEEEVWAGRLGSEVPSV